MDNGGQNSHPVSSWTVNNCYTNSYFVSSFHFSLLLCILLYGRTKQVKSTVPVCCQRTTPTCPEASGMAKMSTRQANCRLHIQPRPLAVPLSTHYLTQRTTLTDLRFILTSWALPIQFPSRCFLATIRHKYPPWSVATFFTTLVGIKTWARILPVHPLNNGVLG